MSLSRSLIVGAAAVAAVSAAVGVWVLAAGTGAPSRLADPPALTAPAASAVREVDPAPGPGSRHVGLGPAVVAVPAAWGTNAARCGVPQDDTVLVDLGPIDLCSIARPAGVESVEVTRGRAPVGFSADRALLLDGEVALREDTTCTVEPDGTPLCEGTVRLPASAVSFHAVSSTDAAAVDRVLARVRVTSEQRGVPGYQDVVVRSQARSGQRYVDALREQRFAPRVRTVARPRLPAGFVVAVSPPPGTMLDHGAPVSVEVSGVSRSRSRP